MMGLNTEQLSAEEIILLNVGQKQINSSEGGKKRT